jgi:hypothetical protein
MKVPQHPNIALAIEALEKGNSDGAWHLLRAVPKQTEVAVFDQYGLPESTRYPEMRAPTVQELDIERWLGHPSYHDGFGRAPDLWSLAQIKAATTAMLSTQPSAQPAVPLTDVELDVCRQWFNSIKDTNGGYLRPYDYALAEKLHQLMGLRVPDSVKQATPPAAQRQWELPVLVSEAQIDRALAAACLRNTPESRKDMRRALEAALSITPGVS